MKLAKNVFIKGAIYLAMATLIGKVLGAFYRIPLTNLIGGYGMGVYQTVFPVYALLLDFSGAGAPSAISKIISSYKGEDKENYAYNYLKTALKVLVVIGLFASFLMVVFAKFFAKLQSCKDAFLGYLLLAPAITFVCILSCFRGYFQGLMQMKPTAVTQITEQLFKLIFGLGFAYLAYPNIALAVGGTTLAITLSEGLSCLILYSLYKKRKKHKQVFYFYNKCYEKYRAKTLIKTAFPFILIGIAMPFSHFIDSFLVVNILNNYTLNATVLYGLMSGAVHTVINLPVALCYGISTVTVPSVSSANDIKQKNDRIQSSLILTLCIALPCAIGCYFFAPVVVKILFNGLSVLEKDITVGLLKVCAPAIVLLCLIQTQNSILISSGKKYFPVVTLFVGVLVKTGVSIWGLSNPSINIYGSAFGLIACYFFVCLVNLIMIIRLKVKDESSSTCIRQLAN